MTMLKHPGNDASVVDLTAALAPSNQERNLSRRAQALLASAGMDLPERHWYVLTVARAADAGVGEMLAFANVECWLPHVMVPGRRPRGRKRPVGPDVARLALPGYVFVRIAGNREAWAALAAVKGVTGILGADGWPMRVPPDEMRKLREALGANQRAAGILLDVPKAGDRVSVRHGVFEHQTGKVGKIEDRGTAIVDILIFGRVTPVTLDLVHLAKM